MQASTVPIKIVERILDEECSLGERLMLVEVLGNASSALSNEKDLLLEANSY